MIITLNKYYPINSFNASGEVHFGKSVHTFYVKMLLISLLLNVQCLHECVIYVYCVIIVYLCFTVFVIGGAHRPPAVPTVTMKRRSTGALRRQGDVTRRRSELRQNDYASCKSYLVYIYANRQGSNLTLARGQ